MPRLPITACLLTILLLATGALAVEKLYFADNGNDKILRCDLDGTNLEELVTTGIVNVGSIAIDRTGGRMYWTDWPSASACIRRADLDGTDVETILTGLSGPYGIALDVAGGKVYWTEFSSRKIRRADLDGAGVEDLVAAGLSYPSGIALDLAGGKMYWGDGATEYSAKIQRANLDGTGVETLVEDPLVAPQFVALDLLAGKMYWSDLGTDSWWRANLDGSNLEEILPSAYGTPIGCALDLDAAKLYVSEYGSSDSVIKRANLDGSGVEVLLSSGVGAIYGLALGPAEAECGDAWLAGPWIAVVTGVEVYDYAVWLIFDGAGTMEHMGAYDVPYPAGTYAVSPDCTLTGEIWSDGYIPFWGQVFSDSTAELDIGSGPFELLKVSAPGALEGCWSGWFAEDSTGTIYNVSLQLDDGGTVVSSGGFSGPVTGRILAEQGHLAGFLTVFGLFGPTGQMMFQDAASEGDSLLYGTYGMNCTGGCDDGTFHLRPCSEISDAGPSARPSPLILRSRPNPFNPRTVISFTLAEPAVADLRVFDLAGRLVRVLAGGEIIAGGPHEIVWNGRDEAGREVASGTYVCRLRAGDLVTSTRLTLLR
jgi:sugar lactone lactonase YvrE